MRLQCACVWLDERCPNDATQEDGLCDWCGTRRMEDLRGNPNALIDPLTNEIHGLGGRGEAHVNPDARPDTCWMTNSGRQVVRTPITPDTSIGWELADEYAGGEWRHE